MDHKITKWILLTILFMRPGFIILIQSQRQVPCIFLFGDSLFDNGNNNLIHTHAKVNYFPYGVDYHDGATGRFNNGRNTADFIAELLGFDNHIPPFATAKGSVIHKGVNYASGAAGILHKSGSHVGDRINMDGQLQNHNITVSRIQRLLGHSRSKADGFLRRCLYTIHMGSNDYLNNYFLPLIYPSSRLHTPDQFAKILIQHYSKQLMTMYEYGARKIAAFGIGLLGCLPQELQKYPTNGSPCVDWENSAVKLFNERLKLLIDRLNNNLPDAQFIYLNLTSIMTGDPSSVGILVPNAPCCVVSPNTGLCVPNQAPCSNRDAYIFFDNFHTSETVNRLTAVRAYTAAIPSDAYPVDIQRLLQQ